MPRHEALLTVVETLDSFSIVVDLGSVQTAKRIGVVEQPAGVTQALDEIARQLEALRSASGPPRQPFDPLHPALADL